jgi:hypothetical protein
MQEKMRQIRAPRKNLAEFSTSSFEGPFLSQNILLPSREPVSLTHVKKKIYLAGKVSFSPLYVSCSGFADRAGTILRPVSWTIAILLLPFRNGRHCLFQ